MRLITILFPVFNQAQATIFVAISSIFVFTAAFDDPLLALYMGVGAYIGIVLSSLLFCLAPDQAEIREDEIDRISAFLETEPFAFPIEERVWAPAGSRSPWFKSDWTSIEETEDGKLFLKGRKRDLKIILSEIRKPDDKLR